MSKFLILSTFFIIQSLWANAGDLFSRSQSQGLTQQEEFEAENYIHTGISRERLQEICSGDQSSIRLDSEQADYFDRVEDRTTNRRNLIGRPTDSGVFDLCQNMDQAFDNNVLRTIETMMPIVTRGYSAIIGGSSLMGLMMQGNQNTPSILPMKRNAKDADGNRLYVNSDGEEKAVAKAKDNLKDDDNWSRKKEEAKMDLCAFIPLISDLAANANQQGQNERIMQNMQNTPIKNRDAEIFYANSESHQEMARTSEMQMYGWGATSACYVGYMIAGYTNPNTWIKMGFSASIATFYGFKKKAHEQKAALNRAIGESFDMKGECNPHTRTSCFCSQASSYQTDPTNFQKYCIPQSYVRDGQDSSKSFPCVDAKGNVDRECQCRRNRNCFDTVLNQEAFRIGLSPTAMKNPMEGISHLSNGFDAGNLGAAYERNMAMARDAMKKFQPSSKPNLTDKNAQDEAKLLSEKAGLPPALAATNAALRLPPGMMGNSMPSGLANSLNSGLGANVIEGAKSAEKPQDIKLKSGESDPSRVKMNQGANPFQRGKTAASQGGIEIEKDFSSLGAKASMDVDITKDSQKGIFDILSHRYKIRAWKDFEAHKNLEE